MTEPMTDAPHRPIDGLRAERDAAVARAMPEARLMRTVEEVEALRPGDYRVLPPWNRREWIVGRRYPTRTWTLLIDMGASGVMDQHLVGALVIGPLPLPDLPTPTEGETP